MTTSGDGTAITAYVDESRKPVRDPRSGRVMSGHEVYVVAAAVTFSGDEAHLSAGLQAIADEVAGGNPLHWKDLTRTRQDEVVYRVRDLADWQFSVYETSKPFDGGRHTDAFVRSRILRVAFGDLAEGRGVTRLVLETRSQPAAGFTTHDDRDHGLLASMLNRHDVPQGLHLEHRGKEEPILWLADIVAGARSDYLCAINRTRYALLEHRRASAIAISLP